MNIFNKEEYAKIHQKVNSALDGNGFIINISQNFDEYPVLVFFENRNEQYFTEDGRLYASDKLPSLRFGHIDETAGFDYGTPDGSNA